jgi:hypothetical protein
MKNNIQIKKLIPKIIVIFYSIVAIFYSLVSISFIIATVLTKIYNNEYLFPLDIKVYLFLFDFYSFLISFIYYPIIVFVKRIYTTRTFIIIILNHIISLLLLFNAFSLFSFFYG